MLLRQSRRLRDRQVLERAESRERVDHRPALGRAVGAELRADVDDAGLAVLHQRRAGKRLRQAVGGSQSDLGQMTESETPVTFDTNEDGAAVRPLIVECFLLADLANANTSEPPTAMITIAAMRAVRSVRRPPARAAAAVRPLRACGRRKYWGVRGSRLAGVSNPGPRLRRLAPLLSLGPERRISIIIVMMKLNAARAMNGIDTKPNSQT